MKPCWLRSGWPGWALLALGVGAWDALAPETMSNAWRRAHQHPLSYAATVATWTYLTAHLFNLIPPRYDPLELVDRSWIVRTGVRGAPAAGENRPMAAA